MRREGWERALYAFIRERTNTPFKWGSQDCSMMACDWLVEATGVDPCLGLRGQYHTALGAARLLKKWGGLERIVEYSTRANGWPQIEPKCAQRGDIVILDTESGQALGICAGLFSAFPGPGGITMRRTAECRKAWRIK